MLQITLYSHMRYDGAPALMAAALVVVVVMVLVVLVVVVMTARVSESLMWRGC
jgi:ABC-type spermidine/putrescine transport system permease subunit II